MDFYGTIGPACADVKLLQQMVEAGMTGIRMNLSHGPQVEHWLAVSVSVQAVFIIIMTALSTKYLDPQNERFKAGNKILKKHKSQ